MRGKRPLSEKQVKSLRKLVEGNELHELLLNLSVDLMLRGGDLLRLRVSDVLTESGTVKSEVKIKQQKTKKTTLSIPLSKNSINVIKKYIVGRDMDDFVFRSQFSHFTKRAFSIFQYSRIVKKWMGEHLGLDDVSSFSMHSLRKTKSSVIYQKTQSVEIVRRLLGQSSVTATSTYFGIEDSDALEVARTTNI